MRDPVPIGEELGQGRSELEIQQAIAAAWDELDAVLDDAKLAHLMHLEDRFDQSRAGQLVWLAYLGRARRNPSMVGEERPEYACKCRDTGWVAAFCTCGVVEHVAYRPCELCNRVAYHLWRTGHYAPGHRCAQCSGKKRAPQESAREVLAEERAEDDARAIEQELF